MRTSTPPAIMDAAQYLMTQFLREYKYKLNSALIYQFQSYFEQELYFTI